MKSSEDLQNLKERVDRYGHLKTEASRLDKRLREIRSEFAKIAKELTKGYNDLVEVTLQGDEYLVKFNSVRTPRQVTDPQKVYNALAEKDSYLPFQLMQFKLTDLDMYLTEEEKSTLLSTYKEENRRASVKKLSS